MKEKSKIKEYLKCVLTEQEIKESGAQLAKSYSDMSELEDAKKSIVSDFKARIDKMAADISGFARKIQNGYEFRNVECEEVRDYDEKFVEVIRLDTGETLRTRVMTADELQTRLFKSKKEDPGPYVLEPEEAETGEDAPATDDDALLQKMFEKDA